MPFIAMRCKHCNGVLEVSPSENVWSCPFCGTKNVLTKDSTTVVVRMDRTEGLVKLTAAMDSAYADGDGELAHEYADKILAIDASNAAAHLTESRYHMGRVSEEVIGNLGCGTSIGDINPEKAFAQTIGPYNDFKSSLRKYNSSAGEIITPTDVFREVNGGRGIQVSPDLTQGDVMFITGISADADKIVLHDDSSTLSIVIRKDFLHIVSKGCVYNIRGNGFLESGVFDDEGNLLEGVSRTPNCSMEGSFKSGHLTDGKLILFDSLGNQELRLDGQFVSDGRGVRITSGTVSYVSGDGRLDCEIECADWTYSEIQGDNLSSKSRYRVIENVLLRKSGTDYRGKIFWFIRADHAMIEYRTGLLTNYSEDICHFIGKNASPLSLPVDFIIPFDRWNPDFESTGEFFIPLNKTNRCSRKIR